MSCDAVRRLLGALADDELVGSERREVEEHLARCPACAAALAGERRLAAALREGLGGARAPEPLRRRVVALLEADARRGARRWRWAGWAAALLAGVSVLWALRPARLTPREAGAAGEFVGLATDAHLRHLLGLLPMDVRSERPDEISRWFEGRVPFRLVLPEHPQEVAEHTLSRLEGARLLSFRGESAAYLAYLHAGDRPVSLLVASSSTVLPEGGQVVRSGTLDFHVQAVAGLNVISWVDKGLTYALVSDAALRGGEPCLVCHTSPGEKRHLEPLAQPGSQKSAI